MEDGISPITCTNNIRPQLYVTIFIKASHHNQLESQFSLMKDIIIANPMRLSVICLTPKVSALGDARKLGALILNGRKTRLNYHKIRRLFSNSILAFPV